jgi:hypothetical protein
MGFDDSRGRMIAAYTAALGVLYVLMGLLETLIWLRLEVQQFMWIARAFNVVGDIFAGFVLFVIGVVYLSGLGPVWRGDREGLSYVTVGALMSTALLILYTVNILSNGLGFALGFEDWMEWTLLSEIKPGLLLWFPSIPAVLVTLKRDWRG